MRHTTTILVLLSLTLSTTTTAQQSPVFAHVPGFENRIRRYVDSLRIIDTHEHLIGPEILRKSYFLDFTLLFMQNGYDDLISAGMPDTLFDDVFNEPLSPIEKWRIIEPYWKKSFNTSFNRMIIYSIRNLYGIEELNESTVGPLSEKIKNAYETGWFDNILRDSCKIDYIIEDGNYITGKDEYFRYVKRFDDWLLLRSRFGIDSLAIKQLDPIYTLDDLVESLTLAFENEVNKGMKAVKVFCAYYRPLFFARTSAESAKKVFRNLVNGEGDYRITMAEAKSLQDYLFHHLMQLAEKYDLPVAVHTGLQAGKGKVLGDSDPTLLTNLFREYPKVEFVLYHGSYPYGGELSALAKNYSNVYIDMNWIYSVSPTYSKIYLNEWLEMVPVSRLMAFGGDCNTAENVYSELQTARRIITEVLSDKVEEGYINESEAKLIARMILRENAVKLYKLN
ncbi:MAG: amidohydrolase family protein [Bacteroidales bacterium]|jgi:glucuronate isomerase|nr:amidohydrolase family protein [Bacteroidales bacterium]